MTRSSETETVESEDDGSLDSRRAKRALSRRGDVADWRVQTRRLEDRLSELEREYERLRSALSSHAESPFIRSAARGKPKINGSTEGSSRDQRTVPPHRLDAEARRELAEAGLDRRDFLKKSAIGAGVLALGAGLGYTGGFAQGAGLAGGVRTVISDTEIAARVIGGVRIATEFIPEPVPAGTDLDPYPGSAIQAALNDGLAVYVPSGTWRLSSTISRFVDNATLIGAGRSTKLLLDGVTPCISAGTQSGWHIANFATDAGGIDLSSSSESRITEIWVAGTLTDNRPRSTGGGGGGGFYGIRAEDFIVSGDGSLTNPYNASAIQDAINATGPRGGTVFVKAGVWRGSRIFLGGPGQAGRDKRIIIMGEGADLGSDNTPGNWGTTIKCGFDISTRRCLVDFYNCELSPDPSNNQVPTLRYYNNGTDGGFDTGFPHLGGVHISDCKFMYGHPALWFSSQNVTGFDATQHWNVLVERCHFRLCGTAIKIDDSNPTYNGVFRGSIRDIVVQACNVVGRARAIDVNIANIKGTWSDWLIEDSGGFPAGGEADYTLFIRTARAGPGFTLQHIDFGDASNGLKDAYLEAYIEGMTVRNLWFGGIGLAHTNRGVDIRGYGDFELGRYPGLTGTVNVLSADNITLREPKGLALQIGTLNNPGNVLVVRGPRNLGSIGSSPAGASPFAYTNNDACMEVVYLVGGSVTNVTREGLSLGPERVHYLAPGDSFVVEHTSPPAIQRYGVS